MSSNIFEKELTRYLKIHNKKPETFWVSFSEWNLALEEMHVDRRYFTPAGANLPATSVISYIDIPIILTPNKTYEGLMTMTPEDLKRIIDLLDEDQLAILMIDSNVEIRKLAEESYKSKASG